MKGRRDFAAESTIFFELSSKNEHKQKNKQNEHLFFRQNKNSTFETFYQLKNTL